MPFLQAVTLKGRHASLVPLSAAQLDGLVEVFEATSLDEVGDVIARADRAVRAGRWRDEP